MYYVFPSNRLALQIGRQGFKDKREWWWDNDLDAVRLHFSEGSLKGEISIESKEGKGTQFKIELPIKIVKPISLTPGDAPDSPLKILLVEDHFLNQIATKKIPQLWPLFSEIADISTIIVKNS